MMRRLCLCLLAATACGGSDSMDDMGGSADSDSDGGDSSANAAGTLPDPEVADHALLMLAGQNPGSTVMEGDCPIENPMGDQFFHVIDSGFPSHVFADSALEFDVTTTFGPGPAALGGVVACIEGASGFLTIGDTELKGMPMMFDPFDVRVSGSTGSDAAIVGETLGVSVGAVTVAGDAGSYFTSVTQICDQSGGGCEQPCTGPIAPVGAAVQFDDGAVCGEGDVLAEDGVSAKLGRASATLTQVDGVTTAESCVLVDFGAPTMTNSVRVVGSWVRDAACGGVTCSGMTCGAGHSYGVWVTDDGINFSHLGMALGNETTTVAPVDPQAPDPPLVGEHFFAGSAVSGVLVCRLGFAQEADSVALDYVELCPM